MASPATSPAQYPARVVRYGLLAAPPREEYAAAAPVGVVSISVVSWLADMIKQWTRQARREPRPRDTARMKLQATIVLSYRADTFGDAGGALDDVGVEQRLVKLHYDLNGTSIDA